MARLIVKSPYFKGGGAKPAGGYLRYIATRERVEILPDDRPPTKRQSQLIEKLTKDFPDTKTLLEYGDYAAHPTKFNASQFLTLAMEENWDKVQELDGYAKYIATRPRAERLGEHGLFGGEDAVDLNAAMAEVNSYSGNIWTHIISLRREDAERLGFDHADAWRALLRAHRNDIAEAMHISPENFRWYAAFHDEGGHPHVHMMAWSKKPGQAYLNREGIRRIKSVLTNQIFQQELLHIYEDKSQSRDELVQETRSAMLTLAQKMQHSACEHPEAEQMIWNLALELGSVKGKKSYGYLTKDLKRKVDAIVDQMQLLPSVDECYGRWWKLQCRLNDFYAEKERQRPPLSQQKEFRQIKNAVIQVAEQVRQNKITFEDVGAEQEAEQKATYSIPHPVSAWYEIATDETMPLEERDEGAKQLETLADGGDRYAQYLTGILYRDGGLLIPDAEKAQHYLGLAARQGHAAAQYALGKLFLSDDPEVQNPAQGFYWLERAVQNGSDYAAYRLGKEYLSEKNAPKNPERAAQYVRIAAKQGTVVAHILDTCHPERHRSENGRGDPRSRFGGIFAGRVHARHSRHEKRSRAENQRLHGECRMKKAKNDCAACRNCSGRRRNLSSGAFRSKIPFGSRLGQTEKSQNSLWKKVRIGPNVIIGVQKTQIYRRFAGCLQEVFIMESHSNR